MNKRGLIGDMVIYLIILFIAALFAVITFFISDTIQDSLQSQLPEVVEFPNDTLERTDQLVEDYNRSWDYLIFTIYIVYVIGILILSFSLRTNRAVFFVLLIVVFAVSIIAGYLGNVYIETFSNPTFQATLDSFSFTKFLFENYLILTSSNLLLMILAFFAKPGGGEV